MTPRKRAHLTPFFWAMTNHLLRLMESLGKVQHLLCASKNSPALPDWQAGSGQFRLEKA